jgi:hypothetical protein
MGGHSPIAALGSLAFHPDVTFLAGENGSGKSTILEKARALPARFLLNDDNDVLDLALRNERLDCVERVVRIGNLRHGRRRKSVSAPACSEPAEAQGCGKHPSAGESIVNHERLQTFRAAARNPSAAAKHGAASSIAFANDLILRVRACLRR